MDIRRTVLWMIFSLSLLLLWNNWQVHNGRPSLFGASSTATQPAEAPQTAAAPDPSVPNAAPSTPAAPAAGEGTVPASSSPEPAAATSQKVNVTTDVYDLTFDTMGAQLVKAELVKYTAPDSKDQPMVLLDNSSTSTYLAQTGVIGAANGQSYPTHLTPFRLVSSENTLT